MGKLKWQRNIEFSWCTMNNVVVVTLKLYFYIVLLNKYKNILLSLSPGIHDCSQQLSCRSTPAWVTGWDLNCNYMCVCVCIHIYKYMYMYIYSCYWEWEFCWGRKEIQIWKERTSTEFYLQILVWTHIF